MTETTASARPHGSVTALLLATLDRLEAGERPRTEAEATASYAGDTPQADGPDAPLSGEGSAAADTATMPGAAQDRAHRRTSTLGALLDAMDERAFGLLLLILALPCTIPFLWLIPQIVALPMLVLTAQLASGRHDVWLPKTLRGRQIDIDDMRGVVRTASRWGGWLERLARPRLTTLTDGVAVRIVGALLLIPCASILVPLPSTNTAPGIGVAIAAVGLLERDGILVLLGLVVGLAWVALLVFVAVVFGVEATTMIKDFILGRG